MVNGPRSTLMRRLANERFWLGHHSGSESDEPSEGPSPWIEWFLAQPAHDFFVEIDEEYLLDRFNLTGLMNATPHFQKALDRITRKEELSEASEEESDSSDISPDENENDNEASDSSSPQHLQAKRKSSSAEIENSAMHLYGLIHARYVITSAGMAKMFDKFRYGAFGKCPRVFCRSFNLLPIGLSDVPGSSSVQLYCGHCEDVYRPRSSRYTSVDGSYFGTSFPHLFYQSYRHSLPGPLLHHYKTHADHYVPKIFGFRLYAPALPPASALQRSEEGGHSMERDSRVRDIMMQ